MRTSTSSMRSRPFSASHDHPMGSYGNGSPLGCASMGPQHHSHPHLGPVFWDGAEAGHNWHSYPASNPSSTHGPPGSGAAPMHGYSHLWPEEPPSPSSRSWSAGDSGNQIPLKKASSSPLTSPYGRQPRFSPYSPTGTTIHRKSPFSRARSELPIHSEADLSDKYGMGELEYSVPQPLSKVDDDQVITEQNRQVTQLHPSKVRTGAPAPAAVEDGDEEMWRPWS